MNKKKSSLEVKEYISANNIQKRVIELGQDITNFYQGKYNISVANPLWVISILKGSVIFFSDLIRAIKIPVKIDFIEVSSYGNQKVSSGIVKIQKDFSESIQKKHILIVEDIIDSGLTLNYLLENFQTRQPLSMEVAALLLKKNKIRLKYPAKFIGFELEDEFFVGYGMDYQGLFRNYPYIGILTGFGNKSFQ